MPSWYSPKLFFDKGIDVNSRKFNDAKVTVISVNKKNNETFDRVINIMVQIYAAKHFFWENDRILKLYVCTHTNCSLLASQKLEEMTFWESSNIRLSQAFILMVSHHVITCLALHGKQIIKKKYTENPSNKL